MTLGLSPEELILRQKEQQRQWRLNHPEKIREFHKKHNSKPETAARKAEWYRQNADTVNEKRRARYKEKRLLEQANRNTSTSDEVTL